VRKRFGFGSALAICVLAGALVTPAAQAKDKPDVDVKTDTTGTITPITPFTATYSGKVTTKPEKKGKGKRERTRRRHAAERCVEGRTVEVWHGIKPTGFLIGTTRTDAKGNWSVTGNLAPSGDPIFIYVLAAERKDADCERTSLGLKTP
jgi:hypothetical protein